MDLTKPPDEQELGRLQRFLLMHSHASGCLSADALDGTLTALACGPEVVPPTSWLPLVWGGAEPAFRDQAEAEEIIAIMIRRLNHLQQMLADREPLRPQFSARHEADGKAVSLPEIWCCGFREGMALSWNYWGMAMDSLEDVLAPMLALGGDPADPERKQLLQDRETVNELAVLIPECVQAANDYWVRWHERSAQTAVQ